MRATVGIYGSQRIISSTSSDNTNSDYGHAMAKSVAYYYSFVRPLGEVLTNETVREVVNREEGYCDEFSIALNKTTVVINKIYKLVCKIKKLVFIIMFIKTYHIL